MKLIAVKKDFIKLKIKTKKGPLKYIQIVLHGKKQDSNFICILSCNAHAFLKPENF